MARIINCEQGTIEWQKCRCGKLTASVAHTIAVNGKGLETLCLEKATELMTGLVEESYKSDAMQHGNDTEAEARNIYELETGNKVTQIGFWEDDDYVGVSPDGLVNEDGLIEIKSPMSKTYMQYLIDGKIKPEYYSQMQMQMMVTGRQWCDYVVYNSNFEKPIIIKRVYPDKDEMERISKGIISGVELIKKLVAQAKEKINDKSDN